VTFYQVASSVVTSATFCASMLIGALAPAFTEMEASGQRARLLEGYTQSMRYVCFLIVPLFVFLLPAAQRLMFVWLGTGYQQSAVVLQILVAAYLLNTLAQVSTAVAVAVERPGGMARAAVAVIVLNIFGSIVCMRLMGFLGVAWGTAIAVNLGTVYFLIVLHRYIGISNAVIARQIIPFVSASVLAAAVVFVFEWRFPAAGFAQGRIPALLVLAAEAAAYVLIYLGSLVCARVASEKDADFCKERFPWLWPVMRMMLGKDIVKR
jgi:O-antigen/teichoic acid export membrane protein